MDCSLILDNFEKNIRLARGGVREKPCSWSSKKTTVPAVPIVQSLRSVQAVEDVIVIRGRVGELPRFENSRNVERSRSRCGVLTDFDLNP